MKKNKKGFYCKPCAVEGMTFEQAEGHQSCMPPDTIEGLVAEYKKWLKKNKLEPQSADEYLHDETLTPYQKNYIEFFCRRWDAVEGK